MLTSQYWAPYALDDNMPWDLRRVVHLPRRAGFLSGSHAPPWNQKGRRFSDESVPAGNY